MERGSFHTLGAVSFLIIQASLLLCVQGQNSTSDSNSTSSTGGDATTGIPANEDDSGSDQDIKMSGCDLLQVDKYSIVSAHINSKSAESKCGGGLTSVTFRLTPKGGTPVDLCTVSGPECDPVFNAELCRCAERRPDGVYVYELLLQYTESKGGGSNTTSDSGSVAAEGGKLDVLTSCTKLTIKTCKDLKPVDLAAKTEIKFTSVKIFAIAFGSSMVGLGFIIMGICFLCCRKKPPKPLSQSPTPAAPKTISRTSIRSNGPAPVRRASTAGAGPARPLSPGAGLGPPRPGPPSSQGSRTSLGSGASSALTSSAVGSNFSTAASDAMSSHSNYSNYVH